MANATRERKGPEMLALRRRPDMMADIASYKRAMSRLGVVFDGSMADVVRHALSYAAGQAQTAAIAAGKIKR